MDAGLVAVVAWGTERLQLWLCRQRHSLWLPMADLDERRHSMVPDSLLVVHGRKWMYNVPYPTSQGGPEIKYLREGKELIG